MRASSFRFAVRDDGLVFVPAHDPHRGQTRRIGKQPMPTARLTAKNVSTLPAIDGRRTDYVDSTLPGFVLRVSPSGARSYALAVWWQGRRVRKNFGRVQHQYLADCARRGTGPGQDLRQTGPELC